QRFTPAVLGEQSCGVRTEPEERSLAQRNDACIAEDQVQRQREQRGDQDLAAQREIFGEREKRDDRDQPEGELEFAPPLGREADFTHTRRPTNPRGNRISMTTMTT